MSKSTGPRTARGKARSSQNAAKHWIESGRILPTEQKEAAVLRSGFVADFNPEGAIENELIDDLTMNRLIKRRIDVAFTREFSKASINKTIESIENREHSPALYWLERMGGKYKYLGGGKRVERLRPDLCVAVLKDVKQRIGERGPQPQDFWRVSAIYSDQPTENAARAIYLLAPVAEKENVQDQNTGTAGEDRLKKEILEALEKEIKLQGDLGQLAVHLSEIESPDHPQEPHRPTLETLLRYRAANTREFKDLLDSLEQIRRVRHPAS